MPPTPVAAKLCPRCKAAVIPGRLFCVACNLPYQKMDNYVSAADQKSKPKGPLKAQDIAESMIDRFLKPAIYLFILCFLAGTAYFFYTTFHGASKGMYAEYPTNRGVLLTTFLTAISKDTEYNDKIAYKLINFHERMPDNEITFGKYRQMFHDINSYLKTVAGEDWISKLKVEKEEVKDPDQGVTYTEWHATVGTEQLNIAISEEHPLLEVNTAMHGSAGPQRDDADTHYSIAGVDGFDIESAGKSQKLAAVQGIMKGMGAGKSAQEIADLNAAFGPHGDETTDQLKARILPVIARPNSIALKQCLL